MKWASAAAKSRESIVDALATVTPALVRDHANGPDPISIRRALRTFYSMPQDERVSQPVEIAAALHWLEHVSLPLVDLADAGIIRTALNAVSVQMDGKAAAATTTRRKRAILYNVLQYAVELDLLDHNPLDKLRVRSVRQKVSIEVDRRVVANPLQVRELLTAVTYVGARGKDSRRGERLRAFYACMYYAGLRPGEAVDLRKSNCHLPQDGWGLLVVERSRPSSGKRYTDSGAAHDDRGLKHRGERESREVPIPQALVVILREHIDRFGVDDSGRLFRSPRGNVVAAST